MFDDTRGNPALQSTTPYYKVLLRTAKYFLYKFQDYLVLQTNFMYNNLSLQCHAVLERATPFF